eukprot:1758205-Rhodomonas_salina.1
MPFANKTNLLNVLNSVKDLPTLRENVTIDTKLKSIHNMTSVMRSLTEKLPAVLDDIVDRGQQDDNEHTAMRDAVTEHSQKLEHQLAALTTDKAQLFDSFSFVEAQYKQWVLEVANLIATKESDMQTLKNPDVLALRTIDVNPLLD